MTHCYAWPLTVSGAADLQLFVSTDNPRFTVRLFRCGATIEGATSPSASYEGHFLPMGRPDEAWGWARYSIPLSPELADGIYVAVPVPAGPDGAHQEPGSTSALLNRSDAGLFVLRRAPLTSRPGDGGRPPVLYKLPTATYAAYNQLGGVSLYAGAHWVRDWTGEGYVVSLQRPGNGGVGGKVMEGDAPDPYARGSRRQTFAHWDFPFVSWLESHGYPTAYCTDFDLHDDATLLDSGALLVSAGHDEYWSATMRRRVLDHVDRGGNMCFFAGDVACFEVDIAPGGDRLLCKKMAGGGPDGNGSAHPGALWHAADREDWLSLASGAWGGGWWDGSRAIEGYQLTVPTHWAFDGVEVPAGGLTGGRDTPIVGYETDGVALERASDPPRLSEPRKGGAGGRVLLALARLSSGWVAGAEAANAAMMIRTSRSGGMVFSAGTTDWPLALASDAAVSRITENVVSRLAHPSLLIHGPTYDEGEYLGDGDAVGPGQTVTWYLDGEQCAGLGLRAPSWTVVGGEAQGEAGALHLVTQPIPGDGWLTVSATCTDERGVTYFGSHTVRILPTEEFLRRRIVRALHAMAHPDEQGGALVDQRISEAELAARVIPVRLQWVRQHATVLNEVLDELEALWELNGRMADAALRPEEK